MGISDYRDKDFRVLFGRVALRAASAKAPRGFENFFCFGCGKIASSKNTERHQYNAMHTSRKRNSPASTGLF
jgi:hypothetical protein